MYPSDIEIRLLQGWANIELGGTITEVRAALATNGHAYDLAEDEFTIDIHNPQITFFFDDSKPKRLVQILFSDPDHRINDQLVIGLPLPEALIPLCPQSYDDTLWSMVSIEEEYQKGKPLEDSKRLRRSSSKQNLESGTLWVHSQAVGLVMVDGLVHELAIRAPGTAPILGCGRLDSTTMELATESRPTAPAPESLRIPQATSTQSKSKKSQGLAVRALFCALATALLIAPIVIVYRDLTAWKTSLSALGKVVETKSDGPFLEEVLVEYSVEGDATKRSVSIPSSYTTAQEIGNEVELLYLKDQPNRAMTRIQARDQGLSISPYLLFGSVGLAVFVLHLAFPNHVRFGSRRNR